ncbi:MAG TPA: transglutaminase family protein [Fibrobacteria bacterium]|nr:transglutaminase family protein [Fibrobacteria bacterium]
MLYRVRHETVYTYEDPVQLSHNLAHLQPMRRSGQTVDSFALEVFPEPAVVSSREDAWGNVSHFLLVQEAHREFRIVANSQVRVDGAAGHDLSTTSPWEEVAASVRFRPRGEFVKAAQFRHASPFVPSLAAAREYALESFPPGRAVLEGAFHLMGRIHREFRYDPQATTVATPLAEVFAKRRGVCQDFSHAMIGALRSLGLPARYVSGYLETRPPPGRPRLVGADASHAWVQAWSPDPGWVDFDPTNDVIPASRHVTVAIGRDFGDVTPLKGLLLGGGGQKVSVSVDVEPLG